MISVVLFKRVRATSKKAFAVCAVGISTWAGVGHATITSDVVDHVAVLVPSCTLETTLLSEPSGWLADGPCSPTEHMEFYLERQWLFIGLQLAAEQQQRKAESRQLGFESRQGRAESRQRNYERQQREAEARQLNWEEMQYAAIQQGSIEDSQFYYGKAQEALREAQQFFEKAERELAKARNYHRHAKDYRREALQYHSDAQRFLRAATLSGEKAARAELWGVTPEDAQALKMTAAEKHRYYLTLAQEMRLNMRLLGMQLLIENVDLLVRQINGELTDDEIQSEIVRLIMSERRVSQHDIYLLQDRTDHWKRVILDKEETTRTTQLLVLSIILISGITISALLIGVCRLGKQLAACDGVKNLNGIDLFLYELIHEECRPVLVASCERIKSVESNRLVLQYRITGTLINILGGMLRVELTNRLTHLLAILRWR